MSATATTTDTAAATVAVTAEQVWAWLAEVADPEIPVISVVDLGIVRGVAVADDGAGAVTATVTITPTYSGCPAMQVIADAVTDALRERGIERVELRTQLSPAWTTDWMSEEGKAKLKGYGIAPPAQQVIDISGLRRNPSGEAGKPGGGDLAAGVRRGAIAQPKVVCPNCGSSHTENTSQFGSTPCKALYKCLDCREPFDYFKCH